MDDPQRDTKRGLSNIGLSKAPKWLNRAPHARAASRISSPWSSAVEISYHLSDAFDIIVSQFRMHRQHHPALE